MKRLSLIAAAALAATLSPPALAQQSAPIAPIASGHTLLTVMAEGHSTREPDMAIFNAGVTTDGQTASAALSENSRKMSQVFSELKRAGIERKDIQTSNLSISPVYAQPKRLPDGSYGEETQRIVGYRVNNSVTVRQRKLDDYGKVIDALVTAGANQVNGPGFTLSEPEAAQDEARAAAIKAARERAGLYAKAAGLRVAGIVSISEAGGYAPEIMVTASRKMMDMSAPPPPVAAGELEITSRVTVQFELAP